MCNYLYLFFYVGEAAGGPNRAMPVSMSDISSLFSLTVNLCICV